MTQTKYVGISLGKDETFRDGIGEFSKNLGHYLSKNSEKIFNLYKIKFLFHLHKNLIGTFGDQVDYIAYSPWQKFYNPCKNISIWHSLHQFNKVPPPTQATTSIITIHDLNFLYDPHTVNITKKINLHKRISQKYDIIATISNYVREDLRKHLTTDKPIPVIYNGVNSLVDLKTQPINGTVNVPFFLHISRMAPSKNIDSLINLANHWRDKHFVFAGRKSNCSAQVEEKLKAREISNVTMVYDIDEAQKAWLYANCEAFLFPSFTEGFGLPPIEAMHFGKPVFLSNRTCLPEIGGDLAFYWDAFDPEAMKNIILLGLDRWQNENMKESIRIHAKKYSWENCGKGYLSLYLSALKGEI